MLVRVLALPLFPVGIAVDDELGGKILLAGLGLGAGRASGGRADDLAGHSVRSEEIPEAVVVAVAPAEYARPRVVHLARVVRGVERARRDHAGVHRALPHLRLVDSLQRRALKWQLHSLLM